MVYGERYETYGATICPRCFTTHHRSRQVPETRKSRFKLIQFMAEMSTRFFHGTGRPVVDAGVKHKFMMGLLIAGPVTLVAASGGNSTRDDFIRAAGVKGYEICPPRSATTGINRTFDRRIISPAEYSQTQGFASSPPGACAAPRLLQRAFEHPNPRVRLDRGTWAMSEVFYQPNTSRRTRENLEWVHGLTAYSCNTCAKLVPLLLCDSVPMLDLSAPVASSSSSTSTSS